MEFSSNFEIIDNILKQYKLNKILQITFSYGSSAGIIFHGGNSEDYFQLLIPGRGSISRFMEILSMNFSS